MKYHLIIYGCQMNTADSEEMARPFEARGFTPTADPAEADVIVMNTCTVRDQAEHRAWSNLGRLEDWKAERPDRLLIVAGCAASLWGDSVKKRYPFVDLVAPATQIDQFPELIAGALKGRWNFDEENAAAFGRESERRGIGEPEKTDLGSITDAPIPRLPGSLNLFGDDQTAYITVMRGCNYSCSYCIVPQVRGREAYRALPDILSDIRTHVERGQVEVMLLGQTVNSYYWRAGVSAYRRTGENDVAAGVSPHRPDAQTPILDFADLLRAVNAIDGVERIRFMSPHPRHMRDRVIAAMAESPKVCRHIHLPAQSGSDPILKRMQRLYTRDQYRAIVEKLRAAMPGLMITTDIIVGYPGETPEDFEQTLSFLREIQFDGLFAFKFSPRPGTLAGLETDDVPGDVKEDRLQQVLALNKAIVAETALWSN